MQASVIGTEPVFDSWRALQSARRNDDELEEVNGRMHVGRRTMKGTIITAVLLAIFLFFALQQGNGPLVMLFLPIYLVMAIYHVVRMMQKVEQRRSRGVLLVAWSAAALLGSAVHLYRSSTIRAQAESAARMVLDYRQRTGSYPASLAEVGLDARSSSSSRRLRYTVRDGTPALSYPATFMPLTMHEYDFEARHWRRNAY